MSSRAMFIYGEVPSFYAAIERVADPSLRASPVIVGGNPDKQGKVQSATADALTRGVQLGMPVNDALGLCKGARLLRTDMKRYRAVSLLLRQSLRSVVPELEPIGLAGAFFVIPGEAASPAALLRLAEQMISNVRNSLSLPLCVGIARRKLLAQLAAEDVVADGVSLIDEAGEAAYLASLSPGRLPQVGPKTLAVLRDLGVRSVADLLERTPAELERELGNHGRRIFALASGEDEAPVSAARHAKSATHESSFESPQLDRKAVELRMQEVCQRSETGLRQQGLQAGRVAVKVRYDDREVSTRSRKLARPIMTATEIYAAAARLLDRTQAGTRPIQTIGVTLSGLSPLSATNEQLELFPTDG